MTFVVLESIKTQYYSLTPGDATPVAPLVKINGLATDPSHDTIMLTDVYLTRLTEWQYILAHFQSHIEIVPAADLLDPGVPADELSAQGFLQMSDSKIAAEVAALRALGWHLRPRATGALITAVAAPSPARRAHLRVADRIVAVDGTTVTTGCAMVAAVHDVAPGTLVRLSVERAHINVQGDISWSSPSAIVVTAARPPDAGTTSCPGVHGANRAWLGVALDDGVGFSLPGTISINTAYIGGPSAGLAMALTLVDQLSAGSLTGHVIIAATGTVAPNGAVGEIGGVAEKAVAVHDAGATLFLVPQGSDVRLARAAAGPGLRVIGVTTLAQALRDLRGLGGDAPVPLTRPR